METNDLILRDWKESDAQSLYELRLDADMIKCGIHAFASVEECRDAINYWQADIGFKAIVCKTDGCLAGFICLNDMDRYDGYMELEYGIASEYRGRGYATQAVKRMLEYGFNELDILAIAAWVRSHNVKSVRVLEKCSFTFEGRLRKHARDKSDTLCYSILKEEWDKLAE